MTGAVAGEGKAGGGGGFSLLLLTRSSKLPRSLREPSGLRESIVVTVLGLGKAPFRDSPSPPGEAGCF